MKFFTARTLPIFEQCFGQNKEFFNSLLEHFGVFISKIYFCSLVLGLVRARRLL